MNPWATTLGRSPVMRIKTRYSSRRRSIGASTFSIGYPERDQLDKRRSLQTTENRLAPVKIYTALATYYDICCG